MKKCPIFIIRICDKDLRTLNNNCYSIICTEDMADDNARQPQQHWGGGMTLSDNLTVINMEWCFLALFQLYFQLYFQLDKGRCGRLRSTTTSAALIGGEDDIAIDNLTMIKGDGAIDKEIFIFIFILDNLTSSDNLTMINGDGAIDKEIFIFILDKRG